MGSRFYVDLAFAVVQLLSHVRLFVTTHPTPAPPQGLQHAQASLSLSISWSLLKFMSMESVMLCNQLILCHPFSFYLQSSSSLWHIHLGSSWVALHSTAHSIIWVMQTPSPRQSCDPWRGQTWLEDGNSHCVIQVVHNSLLIWDRGDGLSWPSYLGGLCPVERKCLNGVF